jgi:hypothetical protein
MRILALMLLLVPSSFALDAPLPITLGKPFTLNSSGGGTRLARLEAARLNVGFLRVKSDSRCPVNVACVWAGDAVVEVRLSDPRWINTVQLHTTLEPRAVTALGYRLELKTLAPERGVKGQPKATLVLTKP